MDKYIKRLQTRAKAKGVYVSKSQVREVYQPLVNDFENPTEEEMAEALEQIKERYNPTSQDTSMVTVPKSESENLAELPQPETFDIPVEETPSLNPPEQKPEQPTHQTALATKPESAPLANSSSEGISQAQIQQAVEEHFGRESIETKAAILNYVAQDTFSTAQELQQALTQLRQMKLDILMQLVLDHNKASAKDESFIKNALTQASQKRQQESKDFFVQLNNQMAMMRTSFGL